MKAVSRRKVISTLATGGASLALAGFLRADVTNGQTTGPVAKAFQGQHTPKPLPFDPAKLKGLSEKLIRSHWENNYGGAVKALNTIEQRLAAMLDMYEHAYHIGLRSGCREVRRCVHAKRELGR